jgi:hypothetical protein
MGPAGPAGPIIHAGQSSLTGSRGPTGTVTVLRCHTVSKDEHGRVVLHVLCTYQAVREGALAVKGTSTARANLLRGAIVYATGTQVGNTNGRSQLILADKRPLRSGRYTLQLRAGHARHATTTTITIT